MTGATHEEFYLKALDAIKVQDYNKAEELLNASIKDKANAPAYHNLATLNYIQGNTASALSLFNKALKEDPSYHSSLANIMRIQHEQGKKAQAYLTGLKLLETAQNKADYLKEFSIITLEKRFIFFDKRLEKILLNILHDDTQPYVDIHPLWLKLLMRHPVFYKFMRLSIVSDYETFAHYFKKLKNPDAILTLPLFISGLEKMLIPQSSIENILTHLRRFILNDYVSIKQHLQPKAIEPFIRALSTYCLATDYVFSVSNEENENLAQLNKEIKNSDTSPIALILKACYAPLIQFAKEDTLNTTLQKDRALERYLQIHLINPQTENEIKKTLPSFCSIQSETSISVRTQYESFPYPRWLTLGALPNNAITNMLDKNGAHKILIAGTGTGVDTFGYAKQFPNSLITAIDLSQSSLAYAARKARELDISNVKFSHGDILEVEKIALEPFDFISSCGVLHHMKNPLEGFDKLLKHLKPGGFFNLALYSKTARQHIIKAQNTIKHLKLGDDADSIRNFRANINSYLDKDTVKNLLKCKDYYSMPECRDLLFHVMEHCYTLPELEEIISDRKLKVLELNNLNPQTQKMYQAVYQDDPKFSNLKNWHNFEQANPDTFLSMYHFCLQKTE